MDRTDEDYHDLVTLMYDQLDGLEQTLAMVSGMHPAIDQWIMVTRSLLPERGKRG